jgi:hypothetical protein
VLSRSNILFALGVLAVLGLVAAAYFLILARPDELPPELPPPVADAPAAALVRLTRADGAVEIRPREGDWRRAEVGVPVEAETDLRTGEGGRAAITVGEGTELEVASDSRVQLSAIEESLARVLVREGQVVADVKAEARRGVRIAAEHSDAVAETRDGRLHLLSDGKGNVQAAVTRGAATVTARGKSVSLPAGYQTSIPAGQGPQTPMVLPPSLLLKVKWPPSAKTAKRRQLVQGTTVPGARVKVGNVFVTADAKGRFRAVVELAEGSNTVRVKVLDAVGREEAQSSPAILLDTTGPSHAVETDPDMWKRKAP